MSQTPDTITPDQIAANIFDAGLYTYDGKLSAAQQRTLFGANVFGRKTVSINAPHVGQITATWAVAGLDSCFITVTFEQIAAHVNGTARIHFA